ncbi:MAG: M14 family zinc carboxypeptidase [Actinomycetota bacterium]
MRRTVVGHSVQGRSLRAINIGPRSRPTRILVVGCIHGNECAGKAILEKLRMRWSPERFELWLIGSINPDGARAQTRQNARGVDLNRNFRAVWELIGAPWDTYHSGSRPWSEPESRAARRFIRRHRPDITIWYHQHMELVARTRRHVPIQRRYARLVGLPLVRLGRLPGTATRWQNCRFPRHTAFVVELPSGSLSDRTARRHAGAVVQIARTWRRRLAP